jgi:ribosome-associated heat shock protein Hsp15
VSGVRVDKWLWAVRICPTRTVATELCGAGRVHVGGERAKPSRLVVEGDEVTISGNWRISACRVERLIEKRVGAPVAVACYTDLTPPEPDGPGAGTEGAGGADWWDALPAPASRERGSGRPTKRQRRELDRFRGAPSSPT